MPNSKPRIIVVDDEQNQIDTVCRGLFLFGYCCRGVTSAEQALQLLAEENDFDLLLTDLTMPGRSGIELIDAVQKRHPKMPILVITGLAATKEIDLIQSRGIPLLQKPFEPETLVSMIQSQLE